MGGWRQRLADYRVFWRQFRQAYHTTGAVLPSGRGLSTGPRPLRPPRRGRFQRLANRSSAAGNGNPRRILEVGPGTGAVTAQIARDMRPDDQLTLVERNEEFVRSPPRAVAIRRSSHATHAIASSLVHSGVEDLPEDEPYDLIISGLPLNNFSVELVDSCSPKCSDCSPPAAS